MAVGEPQPSRKAAPPHSVAFVDTQRAEALARAFDTLSHALLTDDVGMYLSRPGCEHAFHHAIFASYLASAPQMVLQCSDYGCCAIMGEEVQRQQSDAPSSSGPMDPAAAEAAEAEMTRQAKEERGEALQRLATQPLLQQLVQEHGAALCVHFIGTHPQRQGQGLGGALLRHICSIADERGLHAYLEASTHRSKELYARHGFVHMADKLLGDEEGAPVLKVMVRPPSNTTAAAASQGAVKQAIAAGGEKRSAERTEQCCEGDSQLVSVL